MLTKKEKSLTKKEKSLTKSEKSFLPTRKNKQRLKAFNTHLYILIEKDHLKIKERLLTMLRKAKLCFKQVPRAVIWGIKINSNRSSIS